MKKINWDLEIEILKKYVFEDKLSYKEIGRIYNCSDTNIKRVMIRRGIELPIKSKNHGKEPHNKNTNKDYFCLNCGTLLRNTKNRKHKYCSNKCQQEYEYKMWVE